MCTRYIPPDVAEIEREWHVGRGNQPDWARDMRPLYAGPFIRRAAEQDKRSLVLVEFQDFNTRLDGSVEQARGLLRLTSVELFNAGPKMQAS